MARLIEVIENKVIEGKGTENSPIREVLQIFSKDGELLADWDPVEIENAFKFRRLMNGQAIADSIPKPPAADHFRTRRTADEPILSDTWVHVLAIATTFRYGDGKLLWTTARFDPMLPTPAAKDIPYWRLMPEIPADALEIWETIPMFEAGK